MNLDGIRERLDAMPHCEGDCGYPCTRCQAEFGGACDGGEACEDGFRACACNGKKGETCPHCGTCSLWRTHGVCKFDPGAGKPDPIEWIEHRARAQAIPLGDRRDPACVKRWPDCGDGKYDPNCCRFPKSCSAGPSPSPSPKMIDAGPFENKGQHWIQTYTGKAVDVFDLQADQIDIADIAHALAQLCRYTGHVREFYSVATHSLAVMRLTELMGHGPDMQLWALLHDAGEAFMADIAAPLKRHPIFDGYRKLEAENDRRIRARFGINLEDSQLTLIRTFDLALLTPERAKLMAKPPRDWGTFPIIEEATAALEWAWVVRKWARRQYLKHFQTLTAKVAGTL